MTSLGSVCSRLGEYCASSVGLCDVETSWRVVMMGDLDLLCGVTALGFGFITILFNLIKLKLIGMS